MPSLLLALLASRGGVLLAANLRARCLKTKALLFEVYPA